MTDVENLVRDGSEMNHQILCKNWPLSIFAVQEIGIKLCEDDVLLIASLVQTGQVGAIRHLDLVHKDFVCLDSRASDAFLSILTNDDVLLDTGCYGTTRTSFSYSEAVQYAQKYVYHGQNNYPVDSSKNVLVRHPLRNSQPSCSLSSLTVYIEMVINSTNFTKVIDVITMKKEERRAKALAVRLSAVQLAFEYVPAEMIVEVLEAADEEEVRGIDLSFNSLSRLDRLEMVSVSLQKFQRLENICLAYNSINAAESQPLVSCLKMLSKLGRLDLSHNRLGRSLADLFTPEWTAINLYELVLTSCDVTRTVLNAIADCPNIRNLTKLRLDQNNLSGGRRKGALIRALEKFEANLKHLDISSCGLTKEDVMNICSVLGNFNELQHLIVYPNSGVSPEVIRDELAPLLAGLPSLKFLPPVENLDSIVSR